MTDDRVPRPIGTWAALWAALTAAWAVAGIFLFAGGGIDAEPPFADEAANLAQRRYARIWTDRNHPDWLAYAAYDHAPLDKLWLGFWATCLPGGKRCAR